MFAMPNLFAGNKVNPAIFQAALSRFFRRGTQRKAAVRPPQLPVDKTERAELRRLAEHAGLISRRRLRAAS